MSRKPKDLNAPTNNSSPYIIFSKQRRPVLAEEHTNLSTTEITRKISSEWKAMDETCKTIYKDRAAAGKKKHLEKLAEYKKTHNFQMYTKKLAEWKQNQKALRSAKKNKKTNPTKKPTPPASMPKRPLTAYSIFTNERRAQLRNTHPHKKLSELSKLIRIEWQDKVTTEKMQYEKKALISKQNYNIKIGQYKKTNAYSEYYAKLANWKSHKKKCNNSSVDGNDNSQRKILLPPKPKNDKRPSKPLTALFIYAREIRESIKQQFENKSDAEIAKEIIQKWQILSAEEKQKYIHEAYCLKEEYKKDLIEYKDSDAPKEFEKKFKKWKHECDRRKGRFKQQSSTEIKSRDEESSDEESSGEESSGEESNGEESSGEESSGEESSDEESNEV